MMSESHQGARVVFDAFLSAAPYLNGAMGLYIVGYLLLRLLKHPEVYNRSERVAMGLIAGGMVMVTPALWVVETPFDVWSFNVVRFGILLYIVTGGVRRDRHALRNAEAVRQADQHIRERAAQRGNRT